MRIGPESLEEILGIIYGPVNANALYNELGIDKVIKMGILRWLGHLFRMQELDPCRKLTLLKPESTRHVGKPKLRWLESLEKDLKKMGVTYW